MIRILGAVDTSAHGTTVIRYALFAARALRARVVGLCVVETKKIEGPLLRDYLATVGLDPGRDYRDKVERFLGMKSREILAQFEAACRGEGISFEGVSRKGVLSRVIASMADDVDLIILGRKGEHAEWHAHALGGSVEAVVRTTRKPALITPKHFDMIGRALVAYDGSRCARDALDMAVRIQKETGMEGVVLAVVPQGQEDLAAGLRAEAEGLLDRRGGSFEILVANGDAGDVIPEAARKRGCNLIVMGAYGHSKIRELILGSTTEQVLLNTPEIPILLRR